MVKLSPLNPEVPRQVAVRILSDSIQPLLTQALRALFQEAGNPLANLRRFFRRSTGQLAVAATTAGVAGGATSAVALWKASLRPSRSLGYELGLISMPLAAPLVGGFIGLVVGAGSAAYLLTRVRGAKSLTLAKLHAQVFSVMLYSDGIDEALRRRTLEEIKDRLVSTGVKSEVIESLFIRAPLRVEDFELDIEQYELDTLRDVLTNAWQLAGTQETPPPALEHSFARLCRRMNLADEIPRIKSLACDAVAKQSARISAAIEAARHIGSDFDDKIIDAALEQLIALDPLRSAQTRRTSALYKATNVAAVAGSILAIASKKGQFLPIIGQAFAVVHSAVRGDEAATKRLQARSVELLAHLGVKAEDATRFLPPILETLDSGRAESAKSPESLDARRPRPPLNRSN